MEHFLAKIIASNGEDLSSDKLVHNRFVRYSKGEFDGPVLKATRKGKSITIKASLDYENILGFLVASSMRSGTNDLEGNVTAFEDPADAMKLAIPLGRQGQVEVDAKKAGWILEFSGSWSKDEVLKIYDTFDSLRGYILLSQSSGDDAGTSFTVKSKVPQPKKSSKAPKADVDEATETADKISGAIKFSTGKLANDAGAVTAVLDALLLDAKEEASNFKEIIIENDYTITDITVPSNAKDKRLEAIRKGVLARKITIDGKSKKQEYPFVV
ncbi:MAG TPA: hypothetical protein VKM55_01985 [Candidatus Lokiarchaeia archaeon]|nr:hypothetical protein [Candidatus Lokiarchaeia archaeon]